MTACIVMATYNGGRWLDQQIESIQQQDDTDWLLFISDDGSSDNTVGLIKRYSEADKRIRLLPRRRGERGHVGNFEHALIAALACQADWFLLADQDDIWHTQKLSTLKNELNISSNLPHAVFSDVSFKSVDSQLDGRSYQQTLGFMGRCRVNDLLRQNTVVGCSLAMNKPLLELALPFPEGTQNHDWWLSICAAATGGLVYCDRSLVSYRQHEDNAIGFLRGFSALPSLPAVLVRQAKVYTAKCSAVRDLLKRLEAWNDAVNASEIAELRNYKAEDRFVGRRRGWQLLQSKYAPKSHLLKYVQVLALMLAPPDELK